MKKITILLICVIAGAWGDYYWQLPLKLGKLFKRENHHNRIIKLDSLPVTIAGKVSIGGPDFIAAAASAENDDSTAFNSTVYKLGEQINESIVSSLNLSPAAKAELDAQLASNYPEISKDIRVRYLQQIKSLKTQPVEQLGSTVYKTRAEILAGAINGTICQFSNLVLIPMKINIGLAGNVAAGYAFNDPCQYLLSGVTAKIGDQIYLTGVIKDLEVTQTRLTTEKKTALAELATAELQMRIKSSQTITRSIGTLTKWEAAHLSVDYGVLVKYGYDLSEGFIIRRDDQKRIIIIELPEPKLLNVNLEPLTTDAQDGGIQDLTNANFRAVYQKAKQDAIAEAERKGIKSAAANQIKIILTDIYRPFLDHVKYPYQLQFINSSLTKVQSL